MDGVDFLGIRNWFLVTEADQDGADFVFHDAVFGELVAVGRNDF